VFKAFSEHLVSNVKQIIPLQTVSMEQCYAAVFQCVCDIHGRSYRRTPSLAL